MTTKTKAQLQAEIASNFPDNTSGYITPAFLRTVTGDLVDSTLPTAPVVSGNIPKFDGTTGLTSDSGVPVSSIVSSVFAPDIPALIYVDPSLSAGGDGSNASPYAVPDAQAYINSVSNPTIRRSLSMILKGSTHYRGPQIQFDVSMFREIVVRAETGKNVDLYGSRFLAANGPTVYFTQPSPGPAPNVWKVDNKYKNISLSVAGVAGLIDLDAPSPMGLSGVSRAPVTFYTDLGDNQSAVTLNNTAYRAGISRQTTGPDVGYSYVHARSSLNPNTINFEQCQYDFALLFTTNTGSLSNACRVWVTGIRASYTMGGGIWADRCEVHWDNCVAQYNFNYGLQANQCWGEISSCEGGANAADNLNLNGQIGDLSLLDRNVKLRVIDFRSLGNVQMLVPITGSQVVGDGISNHNTQDCEVLNPYIIAATKDGISAVDRTLIVNPDISDCAVGGITLASQSGKAIVADVWGGRISACTYGVQCNANGSPATAIMNIHGTTLDANVTYAMLLSGNRSAIINNYGCHFVTNLLQHDSNTSGAEAFNNFAYASYGNYTVEGLSAIKAQNATTILSALNTDTTNGNSRGQVNIQGGTVTARFMAASGDSVYIGSTSNSTVNLQVNNANQIAMDGTTIAAQVTLSAPALTPASYTVGTLPSGAAGKTVFCSNVRVFNGTGTQEGAGVGTGGIVSYNGTAWKIEGTNVTAVA